MRSPINSAYIFICHLFIIRKSQPDLHNMLYYQCVTWYTVGCLCRSILFANKVDSVSSVAVYLLVITEEQLEIFR